MNKKIIFSISMLTSLGGCINKEQKKPKQIVQSAADVFTTTSLPMILEGKQENIDEQVDGFFDEELGEFVFADTVEVDDSVVSIASASTIESIDWAHVEDAYEKLPNVYFEFDKYALKKEQKAELVIIADTIKDLIKDLDESEVISIEGHACHYKGTEIYNYGLSKLRATAVYDALVALGVDPQRLRIVARGQDIPAIVDGKPVTGNKEEQWPNRRVEIRVVDVA